MSIDDSQDKPGSGVKEAAEELAKEILGDDYEESPEPTQEKMPGPTERPRLVISKSSWHYRFLFWSAAAPISTPKDLCSYFWNVVGAILFTALIGVLGVIVSYLAVNALVSPFITGGVALYLGHGVSTSWLSWMLGVPPSSALVVFPWHFLIEITVWGIVGWVCRQMYLEKYPSEPVPDTGFTKVTKEYLRARKEKYCPLIDVVD